MWAGSRAADVYAAAEKFGVGIASAGVDPSALPTVRVRSPIESQSDLGVLSWRWDVDPVTGLSRNVGLAIVQAKYSGIRHLFIDQVSIDQQLAGDDLIGAVIEFSELFKSVPVIAAYDCRNISTRWLHTMRRPWIAREARMFAQNPGRVTYVGYVDGQGTSKSFNFQHMLMRLWETSFTNSILYLLCGQTDMHSIEHLRYIIPEYDRLLSAAYSLMDRNDYLLTAAILAQVGVSRPGVNGDIDLAAIDFMRYESKPALGRTHDRNFEILLDGQPVGTWLSHYNYYKDFYRRKLVAHPTAPAIIAATLGVSEATVVLDESRAMSFSLPRQSISERDIVVVRF
ncbi:hypothetical protein GCM10027290_58980 [Micromonospora sonneratiae]|uniref:Heterokaryon incompatibility domain-containing protein n=1 Tax=Micromonospora sonneratiae TaxID=1184706 RepID=A0ABW3Y8B9_9ACTN